MKKIYYFVLLLVLISMSSCNDKTNESLKHLKVEGSGIEDLETIYNNLDPESYVLSYPLVFRNIMFWFLIQKMMLIHYLKE